MGWLVSATAAESPSPAAPNIVFLFADDLGIDQLGCYGSGYYETPRLEEFSSQGIRFLNAYAAAPVCSPTRASLMTGLAPARLHLTDFIPGDAPTDRPLLTPNWRRYLPLEQVTLAQRLQQAGYVTGHFGKWHLNRDKDYRPNRPGDPASQGFDEVITTEKPGAGPDSPFPEDWHHTREITEAAIDFIARHRDRQFFCYASYNAIHAPEMETDQLVGHFENKPGAGGRHHPTQAAMLYRLDQAVGRILDHLRDLKLEDKTLVVFFSDNGPKGPKSGPGFRGSKGDLYEGGIRMPLIVRWPGVCAAGVDCPALVISHDFAPTFVQIAGAAAEPSEFDGVSLVGQLGDPARPLSRSALYWHYPHYHGQGLGPQSAMRSGQWKLIEWHERLLLSQDGAYELYDLEADPTESVDLASAQPERVARLAGQLSQWKRSVGAQMPTIRGAD